MPTDEPIRQALSTVKYPGFSRDIMSFGLVKAIDIDGRNAVVRISLATRDPKVPEQIQREATAALARVEEFDRIELDFDLKEPQAAGPGPGATMDGVGKASIPGVKRVIAIASGKGGVGKSTVAANLAVALARHGLKTGLCDCDLYGPSMGLMFGTGDERPLANDQEQILPLRRHGVKLISMGFLLEDSSPVIVRGPIATRYTQQFLRQVAWDDLDVLVLDLPPGTGDIQLTIVQTVSLDGAIIVTTPQEVALIDARKASSMFNKVNVPVLGLIENMSWFDCPSDGTRYHLFGEGGGAREAARLGVPLLAQVPIEMPIREAGDAGHPVALLPPDESGVSAAFHDAARSLAVAVGLD